MRKGQGFVTGHDKSIGKGQLANLPTDQIVKNYPKKAVYGESNIDDTITGIDDSCHSMVSKAKKNVSNMH